MKSIIKFYLPILLLVSVVGCKVQFVPDYDEKIASEIVTVAKKVDAYFEKLKEASYEADTDTTALAYSSFKADYISIQVDLNSLVRRSEQRGQINIESTKQAKNASELWSKDREVHREKGNKINVNLIEIHKSDYERIFAAMSKAEEEKKLTGKTVKVPNP